MSFNLRSESNPYARVYDRQNHLFTAGKRQSSTIQQRQLPPQPQFQPPRHPTRAFLRPVPGTESLESQCGEERNAYDSLIRDTTQQCIGRRSDSSIYEINELPNQFEIERMPIEAQRSEANLCQDTVNKRLLSTRSIEDVRNIPNFFGFPDEEEPRKVYGTESTHWIRSIPEQFYDRILPTDDTAELIAEPVIAKTENKRHLSADSQADLRNIPDVFPPVTPTFLKSDASYYAEKRNNNNRSTNFIDSMEVVGGGIGGPSAGRITGIPNRPSIATGIPNKPLMESTRASQSQPALAENKRVFGQRSQIDLKCLPDLFKDHIVEAYTVQKTQSPTSTSSQRSERFDVRLGPWIMGPPEHWDAERCLNKFASSDKSMLEIAALPECFGEVDLPLRDFSRGSIEDLRQLPDPFIHSADCDHWGGCGHVNTARDISTMAVGSTPIVLAGDVVYLALQ